MRFVGRFKFLILLALIVVLVGLAGFYIFSKQNKLVNKKVPIITGQAKTGLTKTEIEKLIGGESSSTAIRPNLPLDAKTVELISGKTATSNNPLSPEVIELISGKQQ